MNPYRADQPECPRFEQEELFNMQLGLPPSAHTKSCPGCTELAEKYRRLERALATPGDDKPAGDWEAKVKARILNDRPPVRQRSSRPLLALFSACAAATGFAYVALRADAPAPPKAAEPIEPAVVVERTPCRGGDAQHTADNRCYLLFRSVADYRGAQATCAKHGAKLVTIESAEENAEVRILAAQAPKTVYGWSDVYIGLDDLGTRDTYRWTTGELATYTNWSPGEPNHGTADQPEHCGVYKGSTVEGVWDDRPCELAYPFICERPLQER